MADSDRELVLAGASVDCFWVIDRDVKARHQVKGKSLGEPKHDDLSSLTRPDRVDEIAAFLRPTVESIVNRLEGEEFTTVEFIALLNSDPEGVRAYRESLRLWGESERYARMVIHGQVIPGILRHIPRVEWVGFSHGESDPYAVPAIWRLVDGEQQST